MNITGCDCASSTLPQLQGSRCGANIGQVQIMAFVDLTDMPLVSTDSLFLDTKVVVKANWQTAITAHKVAISPMLYEFDMTPGEAKMWGEDNSTPDGRGVTMGTEKTTGTCTLRKAKVEDVTKMKQLQCLAEQDKLGVVFFNEAGQVIGDGATASNTKPFKCIKFAVSSRKPGGLDEPDSNSVSFALPEGWDDNLKITTLTDFRGLDLLS